jgi:2-amino-4-hydroxy-6-hydroxymethyldihydropteridine diphosphokinase
MNVIISLGTNTNHRENMDRAKEILQGLMPDVRFTQERFTKPVGIDSDDFLNCLAEGYTALPLRSLQAKLKQIEASMGDSHENHQKGIVLIDLDLLRYGTQNIGKKVW